MKVTTEQMLTMMLNMQGGTTFKNCGLDVRKNFLKQSENVLISDNKELEKYCTLLCEMCPFNMCAVFVIYHDGRISFALKITFTDFDWFDLNEDWHYWNLISIAERFDLDAYGILYEVNPGEWKTIME